MKKGKNEIIMNRIYARVNSFWVVEDTGYELAGCCHLLFGQVLVSTVIV
ncbi:MAG: hypothetical protein K9G38_05945 [Bacteroidales bacterium]|nr:hypothetical protein [Bacteroidales bacterium]